MAESCSINDCDRAPYSREWCEKHYRRWLRTGDPAGREQRPDICTVDDCQRPHDARGLCHGHYQRVLRHGEVAPDEPLDRRKQPETCTVDDCDRPTNAKSLCRTHRAREIEHGDVLSDLPIMSDSRPSHCLVNDCFTSPIARRLCDEHYVELLEGGSPAGMTLRGIPDGGGWLSHGYVGVPVPSQLRPLARGTQETEHRLVMIAQLGRALRPDETVHHANGDRRDNRPENLELWSTMHPKGQRVEDKVAFAIEMLRRYLPEALSAEHRERTAG